MVKECKSDPGVIGTVRIAFGGFMENKYDYSMACSYLMPLLHNYICRKCTAKELNQNWKLEYIVYMF